MTPVARRWTLRDERGDLGVGGVAEQRAPRLAMLLDEREERVDAVAQALLAVLPALHRRLDAGEDLGRLGVEQRAVQLALGGEVLVDQRLGHAGRVGDVVERGAVVAAAAERLLRGREDDLAALGGGHATTGGGRHGGASGRWRQRLRLGYPGWAWTSPARGCSTVSTARSARRGSSCSSASRPRARRSTSCAAPSRDGLLVFLLAERLVDGPPRHRAARRRARRPACRSTARRAAPRERPAGARPRRRRAHRPRRRGDPHRGRLPRGGRQSDEQMLARRSACSAAAWRRRPRRMRAIGLELALEPGSSEAELAQRFAERSAAVVPMLGPMLEQMLRLHLRHAVGPGGARRGRARRRDAARRARGRRRVRRPRRLHAARRGGPAGRARRGRRAARGASPATWRDPPVRLVKTIGDAAMLVSPDVGALLDVALDLHDAAAARGRRVPAAADRRRARPGRRARGRLVRAAGEPREPGHGDRAARQRARDARGPRRGARRLPLVVGRTAVAARRRRARSRCTARAPRRATPASVFDRSRVRSKRSAVGAARPASGGSGPRCARAPGRRRRRGRAGRAARGARRGPRATRAPRASRRRQADQRRRAGPAVAAIGPGDRHPERHQAERDG